jgi:hypothetical protein
MKFMMFIPSVVMMAFWFHVVSGQLELKSAVSHPLQSEEFIVGISNALDDPWNHVTALSVYFQKLSKDHANPYIWASSDMLSREYWNVFQCTASLDTRIKVSRAAGQDAQAKYYEEIYLHLYSK